MILNFKNLDWINHTAQLENQKTWQSEIYEFIEFYLSGPDSLIQKTSGSTGTPKNITLPYKVLENSALATIDFFNLPTGASSLLCIPTTYIGGKMMLVRAVAGSWRLTCIEPSLDLKIPDKEFDFSAMIPAQVKLLLEKNPSSLSRIKHLIIGGSPVNEELEVALCNAKINAYSTFGMTETASHVALKKLDGKSNFIALDGIQFRVSEESRLIIDSDRIPNSPLLTNDVVELIDKKTFKWLGRSDYVINSGGVKIIVEELEKRLASLIKTPFYIKKTNHELHGELPVLVLQSNETETNATDLLNSLKPKLPKFWVPAVIEFKSQFEFTESGKLKRI